MKKNFRKIEDKEQVILERIDEKAERYEVLRPGVYKLWDVGSMFTGYIPMFEVPKGNDRLVRFKTGIVSDVIRNCDNFFKDETKAAYQELSVTHKMGLLFYGKQGTGKTSTCMLIMQELVDKHDAICLDCTAKSIEFIKYTIEKLRDIQNNPIVVFIDEFDSVMRREEEKYLTFLDGTESVNNMIFIGCTNYIDKIPERFKKRKSRIKKCHNINALPDAVYKEYLIDRVPSMEMKKIEEFVHHAAENGLTIDQLKHALIDHKIDRVPIKTAVKEATHFGDEEEDE